MNPASIRNIGAFVSVAASVLPQAATGTVTGASVDRFALNNPMSCVLHGSLGAVSGAPAAVAVATKVQHAPDGATWSDYVPPGASAVAETATLTAADSDTALAIDLSSADRFIRAVTAVALTGGTSPSAIVATEIVLGGASLLPAV